MPQIYTFWHQNRPGDATCLIDVTVYEPFSTLFFTDTATNQIVMCSLHCPATLVVVAGENGVIGFRDGKKSVFKTPTGLCLHGHLLFGCDSGNSVLRIVDTSHLLSRKKNNVQLDETVSETRDEDHADDSIPIPSKCTVTAKINLASTGFQLQQPFSVCLGCQLMQDYPDLYVGDIGTKTICKITDFTVSSRATKARFRQFYPSTKSSSTILLMGLAYLKDQVIFANAEHGKANIIVLNANGGTASRQITSSTISSPSSHIVVKLDLFEYNT